MTVTPLEWRWRRWRLREGEFAPPWDGPRPAEFPKVIPLLWWTRLAAFLARRKAAASTAGVYAQPGALARHPRGGVEDIVRYRKAGLRWLLWNAEYPPADWSTVRAWCDQQGVAHGPWFHARSLGQIEWLLQLAAETRAQLVGINVEDELETTLSPQVIAQAIDRAKPSAKVCTILLGWQGSHLGGVHGGPDYRQIARWPALLEIFPQPAGSDGPIVDTYWPPKVKWLHCQEHTKALGLSTPLQLAQCYGKAQPDWYLWPNRALYTLDDASPRIEEWLS